MSNFLDQNNPKSKYQRKNENENFKAFKNLAVMYY